jgi:monomeric sarcosine oxidase
MEEQFDFVVIGAGALGSGAAYWLSRLAPGSRVLVIEQFALGHRNGASEDHSRIIRRAYDQQHYVRLTRAMFDAWATVEEEASTLRLYFLCGGLDLADPGGDAERVVRDTAQALAAQGIDHEWLNDGELQHRFPAFVVPPGTIALYQSESGVLDVGRATATQLRLARARGVELRAVTSVTGLEEDGDQVVVETGAGHRVRAGRLIVCAGRWTNRLLAQVEVRLPLRYTREQVNYFAVPRPGRFSPEHFPIWIWHKEVQDGEEELYGFPADHRGAVKVVGHYGPWITDLPTEVPVDEGRTASVRRFIDAHLPDARGPLVESRACVYELPPDHDFILDAVPGHPALVVGVGAGHAAKFASLAGRILAEIAVDGATGYDVEAFSSGGPPERPAGLAGPRAPVQSKMGSRSRVRLSS